MYAIFLCDLDTALLYKEKLPERTMIEIPIPHFGPGRPASGKITIAKIVTDYTETLSCGGIRGIKAGDPWPLIER